MSTGSAPRAEGVFDRMTTNAAGIFKQHNPGLVLGTWNECDGGALLAFPSKTAYRGASGGWLCALIFPGAESFTTTYWSPMFARGGGAASGLADERFEFDTLEEAKEAALEGLRGLEQECKKGRRKFRRILAVIGLAAAGAAAIFFTR